MRDITLLAEAPFEFLAEILGEQHAPVLPTPELPPDLQRHRALAEEVQPAEAAQQSHRVGGDDEAGTDLGQGGRLLVHGRLDPGAVQERRGGQTADSSADHGHPQVRRVSRVLAAHSLTPVVEGMPAPAA